MRIRRAVAGAASLSLSATLGMATLGSSPANAAELPAPYAASSEADVATLSADLLGGELAGLVVGHAESTVDSTAATDNAEAISRNAEVAVAGFPITVDEQVSTAPPNMDPTASTLVPLDLSPVASLGVISGDTAAAYTDAATCVPQTADGRRVLSDAQTTLAGLTVLGVPGVGPLAEVGASSVRATTELDDADGDGASDVVSRVEATVGDIRLLGNAVQVEVTSPVTVEARSDGTTGTAGYVDPPTVTVTAGGEEIDIPLNGDPVDIPLPLLPLVNLSITGFDPTDQSTGATGAADLQSLLRVQLQVLSTPLTPPLADVDLSLVPLAVEATAPAGGVECPTVDTDGDGLTDDEEVGGSENPFDNEPTNPLEADTDGDGLTDGEEVTGSENDAYDNEPTNPNVADTDGDGIDDGDEIDNGTDPNDPNSPAATTIVTPAEGSSTSDDTPLITGATEPERDVSITISDASGDVATGTVTADADGNWGWTPGAVLANGDYTITADGAANGPGVDDTRSFTVNTAIPSDTVIIAPAEDSALGADTVTVAGTGQAGTEIMVAVDGGTPTPVTVDADGNWSLDISDLDEGAHTVIAEGNGTDDAVTFTVDTIAPDAPAITAPADGDTVDTHTVTVTGTGEPGATVTLTAEDDNEIGTTTVGNDGNWTTDVSLDDGEHTISATQEDEAGNTSDADDVTFTVDTTAPAAPTVITGPTDGTTVTDATPEITGTGEPGSDLTVSIDGGAPVTVTVDADGNWTYTPTTDLTDGSHTVTVDGNNTTDTVTFNVDTNPADTDSDGLPDDQENDLGTDPDNPDTDGDGLTDGEEVNKHTTDPLKKDTDGDGLDDGAEVTGTANKRYGSESTSPLNKDTDGDGINDGKEVKGFKINQKVKKKGKKAKKIGKVFTDPTNKDTDGDGIRDGKERKGFKIKQKVIKRNGSFRIGKVKTDPTRKDTDGDGLTDKQERTGSKNKKFKKRKTDPTHWDTDRGGHSDGKEVKKGSDPSRQSSGIRNPRMVMPRLF